MLRRVKQNIIHRLATALARHAATQHPPVIAMLEAGTEILPEAVIENLSGAKEAISIGQNSHIRGRLLTYPNGGSIRIGQWCYVGSRTEIWSMDSITIGNRVLISHGVNILDSSGHSKDPAQRHEHFRRITTAGHLAKSSDLPGVTSAAIIIEDDVWISCGVTILQGVHIGARSVIAAGTIVTRDVPADTFCRNELKIIHSPLTAVPVTQGNAGAS